MKKLGNIEGFPTAQIQTIGHRFVEKIVEFCNKNKLEMDLPSAKNQTLSKPSSQNKVFEFLKLNWSAFTKLILNLKKIDEKTEQLLCLITATKRETYIAFEIEKKSIQEISVSRGLVESTLYGHLEEAIINGLPVNFKRLNITLEDISELESKIRQAPINSNISKISVIKEQVPDVSWNNLKIMMALIKKKYGLCREEVDTTDADGLKQATLGLSNGNTHVDSKLPISSASSDLKGDSSINQSKSRELPNWLKRPLSNNDTKAHVDDQHNSDKDKAKKKPKFM